MAKLIDITGKKYNMLTVISKAESKNGRSYWNCVCDCGNKIVVYKNSLRTGNTKSCGCFRREMSKKLINKLHHYPKGEHPLLENLIGKRFGRLTVLSLSEGKSRGVIWHCRCDCGKDTDVFALNLKRNHTKSCGCLLREVSRKINKADYETGTRLHKIWHKMKRRCREIDDHAKHYFQRGIKVCDEWTNDYKKFRDWAMSHGYDDSLTIDRIDNDKGYFPENCRWVTMMVQANNTRNNVVIEYQGQKKTIAEWARYLDIPYKRLHCRIRYYGLENVDKYGYLIFRSGNLGFNSKQSR